MLKRDPYDHEKRWYNWKQANETHISGISQRNSDLILAFLGDMETGKNVSPCSKKGERSYCRLNGLKSRLVFFARQLKVDLDQLTKDDIHQFFLDMRKGKLLKTNGQSYMGVGNYVRDFKTFWSWLKRTGRVAQSITDDLRRSDGRKPDWVYLDEEQFRTLANQANGDYRALMWFMYDAGARVTEAYSIRIKDFSHDFTRLTIRREYAKTFGRTIKLKLCSGLIRELVRIHRLGPEDFLFLKKPPAFNKYLRTHAGMLFGRSESPARKPYNKMTLYDIRHNACCYWFRRYPRTTSLMYRMGWTEEKEVRYYSEFLGVADDIDDEHMVVSEDKTAYERRIQALEHEKEEINQLVGQLIQRITEMQEQLPPKEGNSHGGWPANSMPESLAHKSVQSL